MSPETSAANSVVDFRLGADLAAIQPMGPGLPVLPATSLKMLTAARYERLSEAPGRSHDEAFIRRAVNWVVESFRLGLGQSR